MSERMASSLHEIDTPGGLAMCTEWETCEVAIEGGERREKTSKARAIDTEAILLQSLALVR